MFTGIVETIGKIICIDKLIGCKTFTIEHNALLDDLTLGASIAINGVCLTIINFDKELFQVTAVPETLKLTNLDQLQVGDHVNIERALRLGDRLGGHYLQGHVDCVGRILELSSDQNSKALLVKISISPALSKYIVNKGYIALDGMSITVIETHSTWFTVTFIPHTQEVTIVHKYHIGSVINIETDILGKYVEKMLGVYQHAV